MRFLNAYSDTLAQADAYINAQLPANAIVATQDYIGVDIVPQYVNIAAVSRPAQLLHGPVTHVALYWSTTEPLSTTLQIVRTRCIPLMTFSGFKDHVEVCKLSKSGHLVPAKSARPIVELSQY